ncbi:DUF1937 family protein [Cereibacter azotoformans]|uniref:DUF1937 family protein n=1 Tax=Cereibacter azotoformans TaxID=43057 RepID=UPI000E359996|nr:DUF1937 family protein [Cereibacter azotoformans]AXQ93186.1 DUF1937 family protein [Cereibacter sphaeroides]UIJ31497.1 DUF1937 family protein [Cereibacter azotoformans]
MTAPLRPSDLPRAPQWAVLAAHRAQAHGLLRFGASPALVARHARWGRPVYLASPYSLRARADDGSWCEHRSEAAMRDAAVECARLLAVGVSAVSPIVQSAAMIHATRFPSMRLDPFNVPLWEEWCRPILDSCAAVVVPDIRGWSQSHGIWHEVRLALACQMPVFVYAERAEP